MLSTIINESIIRSIIDKEECSSEEKANIIVQLNEQLKMLFESRQQVINDQAKLILYQQRLLEMKVLLESNNKIVVNESLDGISNVTISKDNNKIELNLNVVKSKNDERLGVINQNEDKKVHDDNSTADLKPLYKVFIRKLPQNIEIIQIKNRLNEMFGHVDSVYKLIPDQALFQGSIKVQDKFLHIHNAHDRENGST
ncbi:3707_t:CDS:2 [Funneliformis geosporum]|uniref:3707_t:CDS:1 n=1 Tax=Funneliformis geosporum TaxID=1117311 RepID=A0A9W4SIQ4_9GLOM|nr:3707_t:CDS:2 [Funneliformis geosporum]